MANFTSHLLILILGFITALGQDCKLPSKAKGYCREKDDCYGSSTKDGCENGMVCCKDTGKSIQKCKDYGQFVYKTDFGAALTAKSLIKTTSECSIEAVPLVVGGVKAKPKEFPHMVAIGYGENEKTALWLCGGSLISENYILSAAHCAENMEGKPAKFAKIGALNLKNSNESNAQDFTIVERIIHPKYKKPSRYYDIALFKISGSVETNEFVRPACIYSTPDEFKHKKATATGWGKTDYSAVESSPDLLKVALSLINNEKCTPSYSVDIGGKSLNKGIISSQFCAGELSGGKDTCQGDSGGPLQIVEEDPYCMYKIIGITSFGKFCGFKNSPAVYTRVSYFAPWIESIVWK